MRVLRSESIFALICPLPVDRQLSRCYGAQLSSIAAHVTHTTSLLTLLRVKYNSSIHNSDQLVVRRSAFTAQSMAWMRGALLLVARSAAFAPTPFSYALRHRATPYERYLDHACEAAKAAGALIRSASSEARAVDKSKANAKDLLTKTDVACQDVAAAILEKRAPGSRLLGEEDVAPGADAAKRAAERAFAADGLVWAVDPIDGTANFVDAIPLSATSVAAVECHGGIVKVVAGAVYDPFRDELFGAARGSGAWVETQGVRTPLKVSANALEDAIVYAGAPPGIRALKPSLRGIAAVAPHARTMRLLGSAAIMLAYVAAGRGAAYFECDLAAWDTAAGALLVEEAGGTITDADGEKYTPLTRQIVAAGACHGKLRVLVDSVGGARLDAED